ncbi:hypothetical protein HDA32_005219 [Spinactinospora alkalitolerans]|uniref:Uncharacterized protein n=1 Tax=Spinactinospora alkalitolerans TaxID=687207 RepID=A0A852U1L9_9ACTN|nr:hypothetical protein [Spinactinospora alkalitolerans]NYE50099.1 hypothetical protein [Spinactinospora alkalitolerans]
MRIERFVAHHSPSKARIFALTNEGEHDLEAVTTLSADHTALAGELVDALNFHLFERDEDELTSVLDQLPDPVQTAVRRFLHEAGPPAPGDYTDMGPISTVRQIYFSDSPEDVIEFLDAAYMIGFGVRVANEIRSDGETGWEFQMRSEESFVPATAEPRSWPLPEGLPLIRTWTSKEPTGGHPAGAAFAVARKASLEGRYVRIHTLSHGDSSDAEGTATSEFVVDVFDAPLPNEEAE